MGQKTILVIIPLILSIGIISAIPFSEAAETLRGVNLSERDFSCRAGQTQVFHLLMNKYLCTASETAQRWVEHGFAEIVGEPVTEEAVEEVLDEKVMEEPMEQPSQEIEIPPYPDQPPINPKLQATNDFWFPPSVHKVTDGIYVAVGFDLANSIMIEGDDGIIIVDTLSTYESAKKVISEFRKITDKPVKAVIYTHGHLDHVHGTGAFLEEGEDVEIYAHDSHVDFYINENSVLGPIASMRSAHVAGAFLPTDGPDRVNLGLFPPTPPGTIAYALPTQTFSDELQVEISGVKIKMVFVAGESSDQIYVWLADKEVLLIGDNIYALIPNIYTLRGAVYRDPMNYVNAYDKMIPLEAEYLVPSHVTPVIGKENVKDVLVSTRDATQFIYDQTIRGMNQGYTADELSHMIKLPEHLDNHPWLTKTRNDVPAHVKQIYYGNLGWFEGDPAFLTPISLEQRSQKIVDGFGGEAQAILSVREAIDNGEYQWAAELATYILHVNSENTEAKLLKAYALRVMAQQYETMDARHWALTTAQELEGKITIFPGAFTQTSPEQMAELPIGNLLKALPTRLDPQKAAGLDIVLGVEYTDLDKGFTLHVRNSILAVTEGFPDNPNMSISLDSNTHKLIVGGHQTILQAIDSVQVEYVGDPNKIHDFIELFDRLTVETLSIG